MAETVSLTVELDPALKARLEELAVQRARTPEALAAQAVARLVDAEPSAPERGAVLDVLRAHAPELRAAGLASLWLFGSLARGGAGADSDVDLLADPLPGRPFSLFALGEARARLRDLLGGRRVDLLLREDLAPDLRRRIDPDLVRVF